MTMNRKSYVYVGLAGETAPGRPVKSGLYRMAAEGAPWHAIGVVPPGSDLPHKLDRGVIEKALNSAGYQLWRLKSEKKKAAAGSTSA